VGSGGGDDDDDVKVKVSKTVAQNDDNTAP
jgi:hypothetical protein